MALRLTAWLAWSLASLFGTAHFSSNYPSFPNQGIHSEYRHGQLAHLSGNTGVEGAIHMCLLQNKKNFVGGEYENFLIQ